MRKGNPKLGILHLQERAIETRQLPPFLPRAVASVYSLLSTRTLARHEIEGELVPIRRGQTIYYEREQFLRWLLGVQAPEPAPAPAPPITSVKALLPRIGRPPGSKNKRRKAKAAKVTKVNIKTEPVAG
jgi:hypothetical protein